MNAADNRNYASPQRYIEETGAIGIVSKSGRYGGTYAHSDIALNFCYWLSPEFQVYLMEEFQRLKAEEQLRLGAPYNIKRHLPYYYSESFSQFHLIHSKLFTIRSRHPNIHPIPILLTLISYHRQLIQ